MTHHRVDGDYTLRRWWNYLRRQLYVLDTYSNDHNRRTNYLLALIFVYSWLAFVLPFTTGAPLVGLGRRPG